MKKLEKEYTTMKSKEKEEEIELRRMRTENRLLRQKIELLETESNELADRLIQGQVTRAEVEETTFAMKRELAAIKQHDIDTNQELAIARERIASLSAHSSCPTSLEELSLKSEIIKQKQEMINCLQEELIKVIRRDIARTYPEHDLFKKKDGVGQESLFNVMKAYSIHDREVGYCQGSAFIVGLLLMQMPEEESFAVLVKIMQDYRMREMFKPSMSELGLCMYQLDTLVQEHIPDLYVHFQSQCIHTNLYASSWFLTLFTTCLPLNISSRIMDCFLSEGIEIIFRIALTLLTLGKHELLLLDMEGVIKYFQNEKPKKFESDQEAVFSMAFLLKINQKRMEKLGPGVEFYPVDPLSREMGERVRILNMSL